MNVNNRAYRLVALLAAALTAACSDSTTRSEEPVITAADIQQRQSDNPPNLSLADMQAAYADADLARGKQLWRQCGVCHRVGPGAVNVSGPHLNGLFGRQAGGLDGFPYSDALRDADFTWTPDALEAWLRSPYRFLPGNRMSFGGLSRPDDRRDLTAWLLTQANSDG
jgi:cytochrome c